MNTLTAYIFLILSIFFGIVANGFLKTTEGFANFFPTIICITSIIICTKKFSYNVETNQNLHLTISSHNTEKIDVDKIVNTLNKYCSKVHLRRMDETKETLEMSFLIEFDNFENLNDSKRVLQDLDDSLVIKYLDNKDVF